MCMLTGQTIDTLAGCLNSLAKLYHIPVVWDILHSKRLVSARIWISHAQAWRLLPIINVFGIQETGWRLHDTCQADDCRHQSTNDRTYRMYAGN